MIRIALLLTALLAGCASEAPAPAALVPVSVSVEGDTIWDVSAGAPITPEELATRLAAVDVAILGEIHDNAEHHARQAWLVSRIAPEGIAFEMVPAASEEGIAVFLAGGGAPREIGPAIGWERLGWPDWELYAPVFEAAEGAYIAGGGVPREAIRAAYGSTAADAFGLGAAAYGLSAPLEPAQQAEAEAEMVAAHCNALPVEAAAPMVEAQRLRDARFAEATRRALAAGGGRAVLITGNGHARTDRGVPVYLAAAEPDLRVLSVGQIETVDQAAALEGPLPYDYVWFSERVADRGDPCAAFK
ncbi:MAG: ChaN family lipoprotein [Pseudomonadota bacterium]